MSKPIKPNVTIPAEFAPNGVRTPFSNAKVQDGFDRINPDVLAGDNLNQFIDDTYKASNYALDLGDYVLGHDQLTNCILEAPNGVLTSSGNTITAKAGLKVLIPNGRNADGTLNNIEYTLENDVSNTVSSGGNNYIYSIYLDEDTDGVSYTIREPDCYTLPTTQYNGSRFIYNITENKFYWTPSGTPNWSERKYAIIGTYLYSNNSVTNLKSEQPINILKQSDKSEIGGWGMPSDKYVDLTLGASGTTYTAPANGYYFIRKQGNAGTYIGLYHTISSGIFIGTYNAIGTNSNYATAYIPVLKGNSVQVTYTANGTLDKFRFIYAEGEV